MQEQLLNWLSPENSQLFIDWGTSIIFAIIVLMAGLWLIRLVKKWTRKKLARLLKEEALAGFLASAFDFLLKLVLLISVASMLGVETASFLAIVGSIGLAVGLALQGSLANVAGGLLLLLFKPFKKGDFVTVKGEKGTVARIDLLYTTLLTRLNEAVTIPNSAVTSDVIINYTHEEMVRRRFYLSIAYHSDIKKAKQAFFEAVEKTPHILQDPKPIVEVADLKDNAVIFRMMIWCKPEDYFRVQEPAIENIKYAWDNYEIEGPSPHRTIHLNHLSSNGDDS